ncbi:MAG: hypothetical protein R6W06_07465 [Prochlorococcaceae cyanobacterium]
MTRSRSAAPPSTSTKTVSAKTVSAKTSIAARKSRRSGAPSPAGGVESSDVLVSAVISTYLLTHLHHVLQRAEYGAQQEGHPALAANYAQLRKVLCLDARTMEDACAHGTPEDGESLQAA